MWKRVFYAGVVLVLLGSIGGLAWRLRSIRHAYLTDAASIREPVATASPRDILWQPAVSLPGEVNSSQDDYEPRVSADGLTLYFVRGKAGQNADIVVSTHTVDGWTPPQPLLEVNSEFDDLGPEPSTDGSALYFYSNREGGSGGYDLWMARRGDSGWSAPTNLGPAVNSEYNDYGPAMSPDGETLYFASNRPQTDDALQPNPDAWSATLREDLFHRTYDLFAAEWTDAGFRPAEPLNALNTSFNEGSPAVSPFGDFLYFASDRPGGRGGFDLLRARRVRGRYEAPTNLGTAVNTSANELDPGLSLGGYRLDFSSDRVVDGADPHAPREYNLYHTTSREVFSEIEEISPSPIDWAALWRTAGPSLLWALLALLLLTFLVWLLRGMHEKRLSLMVKCLLASLAAHLLLMLLFNVWGVAAGVAGEFRRGGRGPIQIALAPHQGGGQSLTRQIRGSLGDAPSMQSSFPDAPRSTFPLETPAAPAMVRLAVSRGDIEGGGPLARIAAATDAPLHSSESVIRVASFDFVPPTLALTFPSPTAPTGATAAESGSDPDFYPASRGDIPRAVVTARSPTPSTTHVDLPTSTSLASATRESARTRAGGANPSDAAATANPVPRMSLPDMAAGEGHLLGAIELRDVALPPGPAPVAGIAEPSAGPGPFSPTSPPPRVSSPSLGGSAPVRATVALQPTASPRPASNRAWSSLTETRAVDAAPSTNGAGDTGVAGLAFGGVPSAGISMRFDVATPAPAAKASMDPTGSEAIGPAMMRDSLLLPRSGLPGGTLAMASVTPVVSLGFASRVALPMSRTLAASVIPDDSVAAAPRFTPVPILQELRPAGRTMELPLALPIEQQPPEPPQAYSVPYNGIHVAEKLGTIRGRVIDAAHRRPLYGVVIRLDRPDGDAVTARSSTNGLYILDAPDVPEHFALTASLLGFNPKSVDVRRDQLLDGTVTVNFTLEPASAGVLVTEALPDVHHLGDNRFDGPINSQFQKQAEGSTFTVDFELRSEQLPPRFTRAEVRLLAKGVQRRHRIVINGATLPRRLDDAPEDGGFGEFAAPFDPSVLRPGANTLEIIAAPSTSDIDDFEFVNVQIRLAS